jgi:lysozyme
MGMTLAGPVAAAQDSRPELVDANRRMEAAQLAYLPSVSPRSRMYAITPERRALLNTIRYAEGTWANGHERGYKIMFGGSMMASLDRHPNKVNYSSRYASAAAGAYQFMPFTWDMVRRALRIDGFHPEVQDQGAIYLIQRRKALHLADRGELTPDLVARLAPEWASFPTLAGSSYYGQPVKRYHDLKRFYDAELSRLRAEQLREQQQQWEEVAIKKVARCDDDSLSCRLEAVSSQAPSD